MSTNDAPLTGVRVLDLGQIYAGGYAGFLLAMAGAEVIKIEPPGGENLRRRGAVGGGAYPFAVLNANKRAIVLDLKHEEGREIFRSLVRDADVVLENFAPGTMERLGLGADALRELNPRLVYGSASGYGRDGPYRDLAAMDLTVQAVTGVMSTTGYPDRPPVKAGPAFCDFTAGATLYAAITTALFARERTGAGDTVEVTLQESVYPALMSSLGLLFSEHDEDMSWRTGNRHSGYAEAPYNTYETSDGYVAIICVTDRHWQSLATLIGGNTLAGDNRYLTLNDRVERMDELDALVTDWTTERTRADIVADLQQARVPCAPVNDLPEVVQDENLHKRRMLQELDHPELGRVTVSHSPLRFGTAGRGDLSPSPALGQHSAEVLGDLLGYSEEQIAGLNEQGVI